MAIKYRELVTEGKPKNYEKTNTVYCSFRDPELKGEEGVLKLAA